MSAGGGLSPRSKPGSAGAKRRAPRVLFTQQDELHNRRVLNQGVCRGQVPWGLYQVGEPALRHQPSLEEQLESPPGNGSYQQTPPLASLCFLHWH